LAQPLTSEGRQLITRGFRILLNESSDVEKRLKALGRQLAQNMPMTDRWKLVARFDERPTVDEPEPAQAVVELAIKWYLRDAVNDFRRALGDSTIPPVTALASQERKIAKWLRLIRPEPQEAQALLVNMIVSDRRVGLPEETAYLLDLEERLNRVGGHHDALSWLRQQSMRLMDTLQHAPEDMMEHANSYLSQAMGMCQYLIALERKLHREVEEHGHGLLPAAHEPQGLQRLQNTKLFRLVQEVLGWEREGFLEHALRQVEATLSQLLNDKKD
jgi:hypothetical protein